ncbi:MAG TPA: hypothetical protein VKR60_06205 [Candidatus Sulfotelmatobacter sp.]|nr:hypothetical protein [Candidatus Sulfotelmatobacter sp.]
MIAVLLLGLVVATAMDAAEMTPPAPDRSVPPTSRPAPPRGCHSPDLPVSEPAPMVPTFPSPAPRSYRCCISGHHIAIPGAAFSLTLLFAPMGDAEFGGQVSGVNLHSHFEVLASALGSPPLGVSLRT